MPSRRSPGRDKSRLRKFEQVDKWSFCLNAAIIAINGRDHERTDDRAGSVSALKSDAAAQKSEGQLSRDFRGRSIFDFCNCNNICQHSTSNVDVAQIKSRPKAALNQALMMVD